MELFVDAAVEIGFVVPPCALMGVFFCVDFAPPLLGGFMADGPEFALFRLSISGSFTLLEAALFAAAYVDDSKSEESPDRGLKEGRKARCVSDTSTTYLAALWVFVTRPGHRRFTWLAS